MIGELQIRYGDIPPQYYANHYLYELERAHSYLEFMQSILKMAKTYAYREMLVWETAGQLVNIE